LATRRPQRGPWLSVLASQQVWHNKYTIGQYKPLTFKTLLNYIILSSQIISFKVELNPIFGDINKKRFNEKYIYGR